MIFQQLKKCFLFTLEPVGPVLVTLAISLFSGILLSGIFPEELFAVAYLLPSLIFAYFLLKDYTSTIPESIYTALLFIGLMLPTPETIYIDDYNVKIHLHFLFTGGLIVSLKQVALNISKAFRTS